MAAFKLRHTPALLLMTTFTLGGLLPLYSPTRAMSEFGLPNALQTPAAQEVFKVYASRMTCMGLMIGVFYYRRMYAAIDILFLTLAWAGCIDGLICWQAGATGTAVFRVVSGLAVGIFGAMGITAG